MPLDNTSLGLTEKDLEQDFDDIPTPLAFAVAATIAAAVYGGVYAALKTCIALGWYA